MEINDLVIHKTRWKENVLAVLTASDPILRRFGQLDLVKIDRTESLEIYRQKADEFWMVLSGSRAEFILQDNRPDSPSYLVEQRVLLDGGEVQLGEPKLGVLIPFGVAFRIECGDNTVFIRLTTHQDTDHPGDRTP